MSPSTALLRTLASVPPTARVVDVACGTGRHLDPLARLGFEVWGTGATPEEVEATRVALADTLGDAASRRVTLGSSSALGYPDAWADWVVCAGVDDLAPALAEAARILVPGGWIWVETTQSDGLERMAEAAGLVVAEEPTEEDGVTHAIFRRPGGIR